MFITIKIRLQYNVFALSFEIVFYFSYESVPSFSLQVEVELKF